MFKRGFYLFKAPAVPSGGWSTQSWCRFIRGNDGWMPPWATPIRSATYLLKQIPVVCLENPGWVERIFRMSRS